MEAEGWGEGALRRSDVLILGGGVIGLCCALELLKAGRSVTLLEKNTVGSGASHGNCGTLTPSLLPLPAPGVIAKALRWMSQPDSPLLIRPTLDWARLRWLLEFSLRCNAPDFERTLSIKLPLLLAARRRIEELIREENLDCEFAACGHLSVYRTESAFAHAQTTLARCRELGLQAEVLDGAKSRALEPALNDSVVGSIHTTADAQLRPDHYVRALSQAVQKRGGTLTEYCGITGFHTDSGRITRVRTVQGDFHAEQVVWALGAWSGPLADLLDLRLPVQPAKGYSITYERPAKPTTIPLVLKERGVCVTSWPSGYRLGSTLEFAGFDDSLNRVRLAALERGAREYLREPTGPRVLEEWCGWRPMTHDDLPILGAAPGWNNLWMATGHGMLGVTLSALTGLLIAELVQGRATSHDVAALRPGRFR